MKRSTWLALRMLAGVLAVAALVGGAILLSLDRSSDAGNTATTNQQVNAEQTLKIDDNSLKINRTLRCLSVAEDPQSCLDRVAGARGPGGATGRTGARGERGLSVRGPRGTRGQRGRTGRRGAKGDRGERGLAAMNTRPAPAEVIPGPTGPIGPAGMDGMPGKPTGPFTFSFVGPDGVIHVCTIDPLAGPVVVQACAS